MPTGNDALDLTRCVEYHQNHPDEQWLFPDQFEELVHHLGGPAAVTDDHLDSRTFTRWAQLRQSNSATEGSVAMGANEADDETGTPESEDTRAEFEKTAANENVLRKSKTATDMKSYDEKGDDVIKEFRDALMRAGSKRSKDMDSEEEELYQSWMNWKSHGVRGVLSMPAFKKRKSD